MSEKWRGPESNRRHHGFQPCALPTELPRPERASLAVGVEPQLVTRPHRKQARRVTACDGEAEASIGVLEQHELADSDICERPDDDRAARATARLEPYLRSRPRIPELLSHEIQLD